MFIDRLAALEEGLTHEGTLYGVPAWFADDGAGEITLTTPKFLPFAAWCWLADMAFDLAAYFTPSDQLLVSPIHVTGRI
jgi:hypothetical protein